MAVVVESVSTIVNGSGASIVTSAPSGVVAGNLLLMEVNIVDGGVAPNITTPSGWTVVGTPAKYFYTSGNIGVYRRIADGTSADTPTVSLSGTPSVSSKAFIARLSGADATTPIAAVSSYIDQESGPIIYPTVTASAAGSLAVIFGGSTLGYSGTLSYTNSFVENISSSSGAQVLVASKAVGSGVVGSVTVTHSTAFFRAGGVSIVVAPAAASASITIQNLSQGQVLGNLSLSQGFAITPSSITQGQLLGNLALALANSVPVQGVLQAQSVGSLTLLQRYAITIAGMMQSQLVGQLSLSQSNQVAVSPISQSQSVGNMTLTQQVLLAIQGVTQSQLVANIILSSGLTLAIAALQQTNQVSNLSLIQANLAVIQSLSQLQVIGNLSLAQAVVAAIQGISQGQALGNITLTLAGAIPVASLNQAQLITVPAVNQQNIILAQSLTQSQVISILLYGAPIYGVLNGRVTVSSLIGGEVFVRDLLTGNVLIK